MSAFLLLFSVILVDAEFMKTILDCDESAWQKLGDETVPPEQNLSVFADLADTLARRVPRSFLKEQVADSFPPQRGNVVQLEGNVMFVTMCTEKIPVYRCKMLLDGGTMADIFAASVPQAWKHNVPIQERAAAFGVYVKSYRNVPVFAASAIQWFPDTWLGNLGFDVSSFDQVPVCRVVELAQNDDETNRRTFKFTESDRDAFYGLLRAVSATPAGWLENEARKHHAEMPMSVTDLFNRPQETRGRSVLLCGTAKRIVPTPVTDSEVQSLFGIDHYYQIYIFTEQSQGNPIVVCVRSLPEGLSAGDAADFSEQITVAAVPYKLWVYETPTGQHYAPILVGGLPTWHPKQTERHPMPESVTTWSFAVFFTLVIIWFACRFWRVSVVL